jgi:hypothetical protein
MLILHKISPSNSKLYHNGKLCFNGMSTAAVDSLKAWNTKTVGGLVGTSS